MHCDEFKAKLDEYLDDTLAPPALAAFQAHVAECDACAAEAGRARVIRRALSAYPVAPARADFVERVVGQAKKGRKSQIAGKVVAAAFVATLLLSVATVILTGLSVTAPRTQIVAGLPNVTMQVAQPRTVNLVFDSRRPLEDVTLLMTLPRGVELEGYPGQTQVEWLTTLQAGKNVLPLTLTVREGDGGQLIAQLGHGELRKVFRVHLEVGSG